MAAPRRKSHPPPRAVIVHGIGHARCACRAAAELGVPVLLLSAPGAAGFAGAAWWLALVDRVRREFPAVRIEDVLDCGDAPGHALAALRQGARRIRLAAAPGPRARVAAIARRAGARLVEVGGPALDLAEAGDAPAACRAWLGRDGDG